MPGNAWVDAGWGADGNACAAALRALLDSRLPHRPASGDAACCRRSKQKLTHASSSLTASPRACVCLQRQPPQQYVYIQEHGGDGGGGLYEPLRPADSPSKRPPSQAPVTGLSAAPPSGHVLGVDGGGGGEVAAYCRGLGLGKYAAALREDFGITTLRQLEVSAGGWL